MPKYFFTAKSQEGKSHSGNRQAKNKHELARALRQEGYVLISAVSEKRQLEKKRFRFSFALFSRVSLKEKIILTRNLNVMVSAGISLPRALKTLAQQAKNKKLKKVLLEITEEIIKGKSFSDALFQHPDVFSELFYSMVKVGEESGTLEKNLVILAKHMERENELKAKIKGATIYPAVIVLAMIGIGVMMLVTVVPRLSKTFEDLEMELPLTTKAVIFLGTFLTERWYFVLLAFVVVVFLFQTNLKPKRSKKLIDSLVLKIPIISVLIKKTNAAYTVRTLSSLISAGVPLIRALEIVSDTLSNYYFKQAIFQTIDKVKKGEKLSQSLRPYQNLFSLVVIQMIEVGEESGETSTILDKLGDFFEEEVTNATKNLASVIEPVLMLIIGGVVGFFAVSMIQPMYSMLSGL